MRNTKNQEVRAAICRRIAELSAALDRFPDESVSLLEQVKRQLAIHSEVGKLQSSLGEDDVEGGKREALPLRPR